ncbi:MAG TPA: LytTR family DNA-binding domain-containing protein, partial [Bacteroidia bacterium]|nr:LytTR family DNA-binding domain-containing protein [Bacteroidia bacterium]
MEIKAIIVDDEEDSRSVLRKLLKRFCPEVDICGEADNAENAYELIIDKKPDLVLLDVQMPGKNGFSILKKFSVIPFKVIFVTSFDQYAIEAIRFNALDYLLKPVEVRDLQEAIKRFEKTTEAKNNSQQQLVNLIAHYEDREIEKKIAVHKNDCVTFLPLDEVTHLEADRNYTSIYALKGSRYSSSKNLGSFEEMLDAYPQFLRISKSCIINLNHISDY